MAYVASQTGFVENHVNMLGALSQALEIRINPNHVIHTTVGKIWRTPDELAIMHRMVVSAREVDNSSHILVKRQSYHGILQIDGALHCFAMARGTLLPAFHNLYPNRLRHALMQLLATGEDTQSTSFLAACLQRWNGNTKFSDAEIMSACELMEAYWKWRTGDGPYDMWKTYTASAVFAQAICKRNRPQIPSLLQRDLVRSSLYYDCTEGRADGQLPWRMRVLAMELECNVFSRKQSDPKIAHVFIESKDVRTSIRGNTPHASLPFNQASRARIRCPPLFGRAETMLCMIEHFGNWFETEYVQDTARLSLYVSRRSDCPNVDTHCVFNRTELHQKWSDWLLERVNNRQCDVWWTTFITSSHFKRLRHTFYHLVVNRVAPCLYSGNRAYGYALFKRVHPINNAKHTETAYERLEQEGYPLLDIAERAQRVLAKRRKRPRPKSSSSSFHSSEDESSSLPALSFLPHDSDSADSWA